MLCFTGSQCNDLGGAVMRELRGVRLIMQHKVFWIFWCMFFPFNDRENRQTATNTFAREMAVEDPSNV